MFLNRIAHDTADELGIKCCSINSEAYYQRIRDGSWKRLIMEEEGPACFGPIRSGEHTADSGAIFPDNLDDYSVVLHLRDPRDMLVSLYYSHAFSHPKRKGGFNPDDELRKAWQEEGVDRFVVERAPVFCEYYKSLTSCLLGRENVIWLTYETLVTDYKTWLGQFLGAFENRPGMAAVHDRLYRKYQGDFTILPEDVYRHKRQMVPGDHVRKLKPETIASLNRIFEPVIKELDYE